MIMKNRYRKFIAAHNSKGFTLLEALISLLVLSIGLLGLAGLQLTAMRFNTEAHMRSIITLAAGDILDRIGMRIGKLKQDDRPEIISQYANTAPSADCDPTISSVENDLGCWQIALAASLPQGEGVITDNLDNTLQITISWMDRETESTQSISWNFAAGAPP
jgi:type IV pilus assembly protein PilV